MLPVHVWTEGMEASEIEVPRRRLRKEQEERGVGGVSAARRSNEGKPEQRGEQ